LKADINKTDSELNSCIHLAVQKDYLNIVKLLLEYDPNLDLKNVYGMTPYDCAETIEMRNIFPKKY